MEKLLTLSSIALFISSNIYMYTSLETCRTAAPHIWWLAFAVNFPIYLCLSFVAIALLPLLAYGIGSLVGFMVICFCFLLAYSHHSVL